MASTYARRWGRVRVRVRVNPYPNPNPNPNPNPAPRLTAPNHAHPRLTRTLSPRQARVAETKSEDCFTQQLAGSCLPEMDLMSIGKMDKRDFGYNWTHPTQPPRVPYIYKTREQLGARVGGQMSAAITSMRMQPTDGFVALAIPFFAVEWLPD